MRAMERYTRDCGGYPFLYADIFMDRKEFEEMFDLSGETIAEKKKSDLVIYGGGMKTNISFLGCGCSVRESAKEVRL